MIIKIKSSNHKLADLLYKNPNTDFGLYLAPLKNGVAVGNHISEYEYHILFQDKKYSYLPEESNAIDFQSYCSPLVVLDLISLLFGHILKEPSEYAHKSIEWLSKTQGEVDDMPCTIEVPNIYIHSGWMRDGNFLLTKYFNEIKVNQSVGKNHHLQIEASSVYQAVNLLCVVSLFIHVTNEYGIYTFIDEYFAQKYARVLTNVNRVPYFVFYLFIKKTIRKEEHFLLVKDKFEAYLESQGLVADLKYRYNLQERIDFIMSQIDVELPVLDVGCGEFTYYKRLRRLMMFNEYTGIDEDETFFTLYSRIKEEYNDDAFYFYNSLEAVDSAKKYTIILSEVIEHNSIEDAESILKQCLKFDFGKIIITTPNADFNKYYDENLERRHEDHDFEFTAQEFESYIKRCTADVKDLDLHWTGIGDSINGINPTQCAIITKIIR